MAIEYCQANWQIKYYKIEGIKVLFLLSTKENVFFNHHLCRKEPTVIKKFNTKINQYVLDLINKEDDISLNEDVANILQDAILNLTEKIISSYAQNQRDKLFGEINIKFTGKIISLAHNNNFF